MTPPPRDTDHTGARRLTRGEDILWYGIAAVTYVIAGILEKGLLNWIIGPLWLVAVVWAGPALVDRARGRAPR